MLQHPSLGPGSPGHGPRLGGGQGAERHPYLQEQASQVVLRAQHSHLRHGAGPALAWRLLRAAFGFRRLRAVCREGGAALVRSPPTCVTGTLPTKVSRPQSSSSRALLNALAGAPQAYEAQNLLTGRAQGADAGWAAVHGDSGRGAGTSPGGQGGCEQGVESLASGRPTLMLDLHQVRHVVCGDIAGSGKRAPPHGAHRASRLPRTGKWGLRRPSGHSPARGAHSCP